MASWHHWAHQASQRCGVWLEASGPGPSVVQYPHPPVHRQCQACLPAFLPSGLPCACRVGAVLAPGPKGSSGGVCGAFPGASSLWLCGSMVRSSFPHSLVKGTGSLWRVKDWPLSPTFVVDSQGRSGGCVCRPYRGLPACLPGRLPGAPTRPTLGVLRLSDLLSHFAGEGVSHCGFSLHFPEGWY